MKPLNQKEIQDYKNLIWFVMHHYNNCSICGKKFGFNENSYFGYLEDGSCAYTCEKCSQQMTDAQIYSNSHKHPRIPAPDAKLWRYMDLAKFLSLLESSSLFFTRPDHFPDSFEGAIGFQKNEESWANKELEWRQKCVKAGDSKNVCLSDSESQELAKQEFKKYRENTKIFRKMYYVNCWHQSDYESEAMWKLYTRDSKQGVAIQTTFKRLYQALPLTPQTSFGMVKYINYNEYNNGKSKNTFHHFEAPWYKRESFAHEKEFRIIIEDTIKNGFCDWNKTIKVDLNLLIENVYISPEADKWFAELVKDIIRNRYKLRLNVVQSELNEHPFF